MKSLVAVVVLVWAGSRDVLSYSEPARGLLSAKNGFPRAHLGLTVTASVPAETFVVGEPIVLTCTITNTTASPIRLERLGGPGPWGVLYTYVIDSKGVPLERPETVHLGGNLRWTEGQDIEKFTTVVPPGAGLIYAVVDLARVYGPNLVGLYPEESEPTLGTPGDYSAQCVYRMFFDYGAHVTWSGKVASSPVHFSVLPSAP